MRATTMLAVSLASALTLSANVGAKPIARRGLDSASLAGLDSASLAGLDSASLAGLDSASLAGLTIDSSTTGTIGRLTSVSVLLSSNMGWTDCPVQKTTSARVWINKDLGITWTGALQGNGAAQLVVSGDGTQKLARVLQDAGEVYTYYRNYETDVEFSVHIEQFINGGYRTISNTVNYKTDAKGNLYICGKYQFEEPEEEVQQLKGADLVVSNVWIEEGKMSVCEDTAFTLKATFKNIGDAPAVSTKVADAPGHSFDGDSYFQLDWYLVERSASGEEISRGLLRGGRDQIYKPLAPGEVRTATFSLSNGVEIAYAPRPAGDRTYHVEVIADAISNMVPELNENNNVGVMKVNVGNDCGDADAVVTTPAPPNYECTPESRPFVSSAEVDDDNTLTIAGIWHHGRDYKATCLVGDGLKFIQLYLPATMNADGSITCETRDLPACTDLQVAVQVWHMDADNKQLNDCFSHAGRYTTEEGHFGDFKTGGCENDEEADVDAPKLVAFVCDHKVLNAGAPSNTCTATFTDATGVSNVMPANSGIAGINYYDANGVRRMHSNFPRDGGDALRSVHADTRSITGPYVYTSPGVWTIELLVWDVLGNSHTYTAEEIAGLGFQSTVLVEDPVKTATATPEEATERDCGDYMVWRESTRSCVWSCAEGTTPDTTGHQTNECVCKDSMVEYGQDQFGRRVCRPGDVVETDTDAEPMFPTHPERNEEEELCCTLENRPVISEAKLGPEGSHTAYVTGNWRQGPGFEAVCHFAMDGAFFLTYQAAEIRADGSIECRADQAQIEALSEKLDFNCKTVRVAVSVWHPDSDTKSNHGLCMSHAGSLADIPGHFGAIQLPCEAKEPCKADHGGEFEDVNGDGQIHHEKGNDERAPKCVHECLVTVMGTDDLNAVPASAFADKCGELHDCNFSQCNADEMSEIKLFLAAGCVSSDGL